MDNLIKTQWKRTAALTPGEIVTFTYNELFSLGVVLEQNQDRGVIIGVLKTKRSDEKPYYINTNYDIEFISFGHEWVLVSEDVDFRVPREKAVKTPFFDTSQGIVIEFLADPLLSHQLAPLYFNLDTNAEWTRNRDFAPLTRLAIYVSAEALHHRLQPIYTFGDKTA